MKKIILTVLSVHVVLLLLLWGGISTLGMAVCLAVPLMGASTWFAYQFGRNKADNTRAAGRIQKFTGFSAAPSSEAFRG